MKKLLTPIAMFLPVSTFALGLISDFEWLEPNNSVEVVIGEPYQLKFSCSDNSLPFSSDYADSWVHYDFDGGQHVVNSPTGYSIDENGVITGLIAGSYAIKFTGWIQPKSGADKWLYITVVSERKETEPNNSFETANEVFTKIRFGLYNTSDIDFFKFTNSSLKPGDIVKFKIHYYGSRENPFGYRWSTFCGTDMSGGGDLMSQDQECKASVFYGNTVYLEIYYNQSRLQYFNYGEEFVIEMFINDEPVGNITPEPGEQQNMINGHEYIDLALPSGKCWATTNYGSETPEGYGSYLEWENNSIISSNWGSGWITPSLDDIRELENNCIWTWGARNGHNGYTITGKNGNSIFLPASGFMMEGQSSAKNVGNWVYYWTSTQSAEMAYIIMSTSSDVWYGEMNTVVTRLPIRPITKDSYSSGSESDFDGEGTEESPYQIKSAADLSTLASIVNSGNSYLGKYFKMTDNIHMNGKEFDPIGDLEHPFSGNFDGEGYEIEGVTVDATSYIGLFGYADGATINNVGVEDANLRGSSYIGGIVGYCRNTSITNCFTRGITVGNDCVGAIVGYSGEGTVVQNCFSSIQHTKYQIYGSVGGLVGYNCGMLENSYYCGTINAKIYEINTTGGIVGYNHTTGSIHYCYFIKYGNVMNGEFDYCGSLNWGECFGIESFDLYGITASGLYLYTKLNSWVHDHSSQGHYRKWTTDGYPSFAEYAEPEGQTDNKEFVDLGLPSGLLWATTNVGANNPEEYGSYFAWGETSPKSDYNWTTYKYANGSETTLTKYCSSYEYGYVDYKETLEEDDDAATANWGKPWRTPTLSETQELISYCSWSYTLKNGTYGYTATGPNGNSIFLPAGGVMIYNMTLDSGTDTFVQSATIFNASNGNPSFASVLYCENGAPHYWYGWSRCWGYPVRPVKIAEQSGIINPSDDISQEVIGIYDLQGHKLDGFVKGINVIKYNNGTSKKKFVR